MSNFRLLFLICVLAVLSGCQHTITKTEIVTVDKPIPYIPRPPEVPEFKSEVDKLTEADAAVPGKVGQAYKYDTVFLRQLVKIQSMIIEQYKASSQNFDEVNKEIDTLFKNLNAKPAAKPGVETR